MKIPRAIEQEVLKLLNEQILAGKYETTCSTYRSHIWTVAKKEGKIHIVLDLQDLNQYVICDASHPPHPHDFTESCTGFTIYGVADLFSGYDAVTLHVNSRDLTTFQTMDEVLHNMTCPQGLTNALQHFQCMVKHVLGEDRPRYCNPFVDDAVIKGPRTRYDDDAIPTNPSIR